MQEQFIIHHGDNRDVLKAMEDNSMDSIVTDPPYELGFMGKSWDASGIAYSVELWQEALRVLKPGGHLLAFSGSRTYHRMAVAIEDAGFEIRDQIMWIYGSGFPKSLNISKAFDKSEGLLQHEGKNFRNILADTTALTPTIKPSEYIPPEPKSNEAKQWQGWGTALKPAHEPIVVARKPLIGTVAANVLIYGTGGLNIDASRVSSDDNFDGLVGRPIQKLATRRDGETEDEYRERVLESPAQQEALSKLKELGRWPANVIHDGSDEVVGLFPMTHGSGNKSDTGNGEDNDYAASSYQISYAGRANRDYGSKGGSAARFFYCAKASKRDRNEGLDGFELKQTIGGGGLTVVGGAYGSIKAPGQNHHPTVKPTDLMRYLCRLVTPPNGIVLDPFMGSGSTGKAAIYEGFKFIGIEMTDEYIPIAKARIEFAINEMAGKLL